MTENTKSKVLNYIRENLNNYYTIIDEDSMLSAKTFKIKLKYDFNVNVLINIDTFANTDNFTITIIFNGNTHIINADANYISYLNDINTCLNKLMEQIYTYEEFIKGFVDSVVTDLYSVDYHINLNTLHTYFKSNNGRAVIYPLIEFGHGGEYVTMYIDSIDGGEYPMKMYSSISFDDAKDMLDFYL